MTPQVVQDHVDQGLTWKDRVGDILGWPLCKLIDAVVFLWIFVGPAVLVLGGLYMLVRFIHWAWYAG
jgi:hypothetical protein